MIYLILLLLGLLINFIDMIMIALCEDQFCVRCENSPFECSQCQTGYTLDVGADRTKCLYSGSDNIIIIGIVTNMLQTKSRCHIKLIIIILLCSFHCWRYHRSDPPPRYDCLHHLGNLQSQGETEDEKSSQNDHL